jgi:hypothetical protein
MSPSKKARHACALQGEMHPVKGAGRILDSHYSAIVLQFGPIKNRYPGMNYPEFCFQGARSFVIRLKSGGFHRAMRVFVI